MDPYQQLSAGCFIKFDWQLASMNVMDWRFDHEPTRGNLRDRMNDAYTLLKLQNAWKLTHQSGSLSNIQDSMQHIWRAKLHGQEIIEGTIEASMKERNFSLDPKKFDDESLEDRRDDRRTIVEESEENRTPPPHIPRMIATKSGNIEDNYESYQGIMAAQAQR